jgi:peptide deformylase
MSTLNVLKYPNAALTSTTSTVASFDEALRKEVDDMLDTMKANQGIGLAANQVGIMKSIIVANLQDEVGNRVFINPIVTSATGAISSREGCLSFPDQYEYIPRSEAVSVTYQDIEGQPKLIEATGLLAAVLQHEIDHLEGKTIVDRMSRLKKTIFLKKLEKGWWL